MKPLLKMKRISEILFIAKPKNTIYTSPQIENEIIDVCNDIILNTLVKKVNSVKCFTLLTKLHIF
ncbi:hypothetical protein PR048_021827 [Dryococelus australis]|uniref:Uncharacterized protein n=1 Tax=Dryococelus australis TaxID=614101 RepID=A0ABQ9GZH5_9NEOP|nr:hypothetical protein PR048_021827 [Dryococelus australis]